MSDTKRPVLEVRNLSVSLPAGADRVHAVEKVSFTVNPGEIVCLVGESGSGKSVIAFTVMGLLAKALKPTSGEILLEGENILTVGETRLRELRCTRMSMIFQEPMTALNPVLTIGDPDDCLARDLIEALFAQRGMALAPGVASYIVPRMERSYAMIHRIVAALEAGTPPWRKPWDPDKSGGPAMPCNAAVDAVLTILPLLRTRCGSAV